MAQPSMLIQGGEGAAGDEVFTTKVSDGEPAKRIRKGGKYSFSKVCPHKAFPTIRVDRKQFKTQKDYVEFLMKNPLYEQPWFPEPVKHEPVKGLLSNKPMASNTQEMTTFKVRDLKNKSKARGPCAITDPNCFNKDELNKEEVDLDRYIVLEKELPKKKKQKKKVSKMDFEIKVNKELEFLLGVMSDAKEVLIQKAVDFEREKEEYERQGKEAGDITVLKTIIEGMMFKVMDEHEQSDLKKERDKAKEKKKEVERLIKSSCLKKPKKPKKKSKKCKSFDPMDFEYDEERETQEQVCLQKQKAKQQTTKELVSFLKDLIEADQRKKNIETEEIAISPYVSEQELETTVYSQLSEEFLEEEIIEEEFEGEEEEEFNEGEYGAINKDTEGYVDMDEVKKKLEELQGEEAQEDEIEEEEEEFMEGDFTEWIGSEGSLLVPLMQDAGAQFNYYLERKKVVQKTPKNITEDLVQFMRIVIMGDNNLREVMKEKELVQFKRKQLDFMSMGMLIKRPKPCQCVKENKYRTVKKGKCKCKCCPKPKGYKPGMDCEDLDMTYNIRPNEFMLMLQVLMNTLEVIEEQDRLLQPPSTVPSEVVSEASTPTYIPEEMSDQEEEEEEDENLDVDDD